MICRDCHLERDGTHPMPHSNKPLQYKRCDTCHYRLPEGKVYRVELPRPGQQVCMKCEVTRRQVGRYCYYCIDHR